MSKLISKIVVPDSSEATGYALYNIKDASAIRSSEKGVASGVATLDSSGKVPSSQLPQCIYIGSCGTQADVLNKEIITSNSDFTLSVGCIIGVKYANTNIASVTSEDKITLNVNNTGAKHIYYNNQVDPEGTLPTVYGEANKYIYYMYDGTYWVWKGVDYVIDTKNTTGASATLSKIYIVGAESQQAEAQTYSQSTAYVGTDGCLYSDGQKVLTSHQDISGKADVSDLQNLETAIKYNNVLGTTISSSERTAWNAKVDGSSVGAANGVASLDANGKVPSTQLPSYVDDVIEAANFAQLPEEGEAGKIYVTLDDNKTYRWGGSAYAEISESLAIGTTSGTACEGNDSRLFDSRPASDVYAWAKASTKPTYTLAEVGSISSVVQVDSNLNNQVAPESITGSGNSGKIAHILYVNNGGADYTIVVSTASGYITPDGMGITLNCPQNGYCELSYLNINGTIYVRGL